MPVKLADLVKQDAKEERWFEWTPDEAVSPKIRLLLRVVMPREFIRIRNKHTKRVYSRRAGGYVERTDDISAADEILRLAVKDWKDVTVATIRELTLTEETELTEDTVVECTPENVKELTESVPELGAWIVETVSNARRFNQPTKEDEIQNL